MKLSNALVLDARLTGELMSRSIAGQVEFWARLGRSVERLLQGEQVLALSRDAAAHPLSACLESVDTEEGRRRLSEHLRSRPFPHFEPHPTRRDLLVRIEAGGTRTVGRFVNRQFRPISGQDDAAASAIGKRRSGRSRVALPSGRVEIKGRG